MFADKRLWMGTAVSIIFLALFLRQQDFARIGIALSSARYSYLIPAALLYFPGVWCRAARWQVLLSPQRNVAVKRLYPVAIIGYMVNDVLPLRAGELARAYLVHRREGLSPVAVLATVAIERVMDGLTLLILAAFAMLVLPVAGWVRHALQGGAVVFFVGFLIALLATASEARNRGVVFHMLQRLPVPIASTLGSVIGHLFDGLRALRSPKQVTVLFGWSLLAWLSELLVFYCVSLAFNLGQPISVLTLAMALANLATSLPSAQAGIGPYEFFCAQTLMAFGTEPGLATSYAIVLHAMLIVIIVLAGSFHTWKERLSFNSVLKISGPSPESSRKASGAD